MNIKNLTGIVGQGLFGIMVVLYFSCFGLTPTFIGAFITMFHLVYNTLRGQYLMANYFGLSWIEVFYTCRLIVLAILFAIFFGGTLSILRIQLKNRLVSSFLYILSALFEAIPEHMYIILIVVLSLFLINRWHFDSIPVFPDGVPNSLDTLIPAIAVGLPGAFYLERTLSLKIKEEMGRAYIDTARAKGLTVRRTFFRHVLPNGGEIFLKQMPVVVNAVISSALFTEFFMNYKGALFQFITAIGWNMVTGYYQTLEKPYHLPLYQPGLVFLIGALLVTIWIVFRLVFEGLYQVRYGRSE